MEKISCEVCLDLLPLVKDGVASAESERAVKQHLSECMTCREYETMLMGEGLIIARDNRVSGTDIIWKEIKKRINLILAIVIGLSILFGVGLTMSSNMFYNILIMPAIGVAAYLLLRGKSYVVVFLVLLISWFGNIVFYYIDSGFESFMATMLAPLYWGLIYASLVVVGIVIAFLLDFAFRKERKFTDNPQVAEKAAFEGVHGEEKEVKHND